MMGPLQDREEKLDYPTASCAVKKPAFQWWSGEPSWTEARQRRAKLADGQPRAWQTREAKPRETGVSPSTTA
jgi:hypothetical protein